MQDVLSQCKRDRGFAGARRFAALILGVFILAFLWWDLCIFEMRSASMEPLIRAKTARSYGDIVIASRLFHEGRLRTNDLVLVPVSVGGNTVLTVRKVANPPVQHQNSPKGFYLTAESPNGVDSRDHGLFKAGEIQAKVIWIIRLRW